MIIFTILGMAVAILIAVLLLSLVIELGPVNGDNGARQGFIFTAFKFGFVYARSGTRLNDNLNQLRKTTGKTVFLSAPKWFNKYVVNLGGVKK